MINNYDLDLINKIIMPFNLKPVIKENNKDKDFWGYKINPDLYYSFFFSLHKKEVLLFTFRFYQNSLSNVKIYVNYDNIEVIRIIIKAILDNKTIDKKVYEEYIYQERTSTEKENEIKQIDSSVKSNTKEALECHWKLPGLTIIPDPNGINISTLSMSERLRNALYRYDVTTVKQFMALDISIMLEMRFLGKKSLKEAIHIKNKLMGTTETDLINDNSKYNDINMEVELNSKMFEIDEKDYINNSYSELDISEYKLKGNMIIQKTIDIINSSKLTDRCKYLFVKYYNLDNVLEKVTLESLGNEYNISRERIRQLLKKSKRILKKHKKDLIPLFNDIIGEKQYSYLIEGIIEQRSYRTLEAILSIILNNKEYSVIKENIDKCILIKNNNHEQIIPTVKKEKNKRINVGKRWEIKEEQQLIEEFIMGKSIREISIIHSRTTGGIRKRLIKLNLINDYESRKF